VIIDFAEAKRVREARKIAVAQAAATIAGGGAEFVDWARATSRRVRFIMVAGKVVVVPRA